MRFYKNEYPEVDEVVMVEVKEHTEIGAYVKLLEYNNIDGLIVMSEVSKRQVKLNKIIRIGTILPAIVLRVDSQRGYIDLSKLRVSMDETVKINKRYNRAVMVRNILKTVADNSGLGKPTLEYLYSIIWKREEKTGYDSLKNILRDDYSVLSEMEDENLKKIIIETVKIKMANLPVVITAEIDVKNYGFSGIEGIKMALKAGIAMGTEKFPVSIKFGTLGYIIKYTALDVEEGIAFVYSVINKIKTCIEQETEGSLEIKKHPSTNTKVKLQVERSEEEERSEERSEDESEQSEEENEY